MDNKKPKNTKRFKRYIFRMCIVRNVHKKPHNVIIFS